MTKRTLQAQKLQTPSKRMTGPSILAWRHDPGRTGLIRTPRAPRSPRNASSVSRSVIFLPGVVLEVDGIDGHALLGVDARVAHAEAVPADGHEHIVEQADAVERLEFEHGVFGADFVVEMNALRHLVGDIFQTP